MNTLPRLLAAITLSPCHLVIRAVVRCYHLVTLSPCHPVTLSCAVTLSFAVTLSSAQAQVSSPHIGFVYPAGGRQGSTFEVRLGGEYLDGANGLRISGEGVQAKILGQTRPLTQKEINALRKTLQDLEKKEQKTAEDKKQIAELRKKIAPPAVRPTPALAEIVTLEVTIDAKAAPGPRHIRLLANTGMSNPVVFVVGQLPEVTQQKELVDPEVSRPKAPEVKVTLPAVLNSQIMPGAVDRYRFAARKGQQLVFIAHARALIPYLADAVPGWFQAALTLYDEGGAELAYSDHFHHQPDPMLAYKVPKDGEYVLEIKDALYRGREDFVYRIEAGELPFLTSIFPLGGPAKTRATVALAGWNLPASSLTLEPAAMKQGIVPLSARNGDHLSNSVPFAVDTLPECIGQGSNHTLETAQPITVPTIVNGRIAKPGSWDVFRFEGYQGQAVIAEVRARRLDSPLDSVLKLTDASGKVLAYNDDWEDKGQGLLTHYADSLIRATLPAKGTYYLHLGDAQGQGSSAHAYRLRVSAPHPDFELRVTPCSINARPGSTVSLTIYALRKDGFAGDINLFLTFSPVDFMLDGAKVPANQDVVRVTLQVPTTVRPKPVNLVVEGRAVIDGRKVVHIATPAEEMMQAFIYHHLVPAEDLMVTVSGQARARFPARLLNNGPIKIAAGGTAQIPIAIPRAASDKKIELVLNDPPEGITLKKAVMNPDGAILIIHADGEKVMPGLKANLIVEAYPEATAKGGGARVPLGTLPAIPFEVRKVGK
jgi:hypothetical protein